MGGSSSSSKSGGSAQPRSNCENLKDQTQLNSIDVAVLSAVAKGDVLEVAVKSLKGAKIVVVLHEGKVLGSVTSNIVRKLLECINDGHDYEAEVIAKTKTGCTVQISHK